jgi:glycosyltransferase involved in cell wall biosynthesis
MKTPGKEKGQVLYLSYDGLTDPLGQSQILPYLTGLSHHGYSITVISFEKSAVYQRHYEKCQATCSNHHISWIALAYHKFPPVLSTLYDLYILQRTVKKLLSEKPFAILHCRSYLTSLIALCARKNYHVKFIFDMRGFWPDERVDGGLWNLRNPLYRAIFKFFKRMEKRFLTQADHIVCLTESARSEILGWKIAVSPITVIPTCVDMDLFTPLHDPSHTTLLRNQLTIDPDTFVLAYIGSWGTWYMTQEILNFFSVLTGKKEKCVLLILTPDHPDLSRYEFSSRVIVRNVKRDEVPHYLSLANATICFIKPAFSKKASAATKMAESWAMNVPVITNSGWGDIDRLEKMGLPLLVCATPADYPPVALKILNGNSPVSRDMLIGNFDLVSAVEKYRRIYELLTEMSAR